MKTKIKELYLKNHHEKTYEHVKNVSETSKILTLKFNLDPKKCEIAALLHDISVIVQKEKMLQYAKDLKLSIYEAEKRYPFLLHQRLSAIIAKNYFKIEDQDILNAINYHTTLNQSPSDYEMLIFISDKLSWDQEGEPPYYKILNQALEISLKEACKVYINYVFEHQLILYPYDWLLEARQYLNEFN